MKCLYCGNDLGQEYVGMPRYHEACLNERLDEADEENERQNRLLDLEAAARERKFRTGMED